MVEQGFLLLGWEQKREKISLMSCNPLCRHPQWPHPILLLTPFFNISTTFQSSNGLKLIHVLIMINFEHQLDTTWNHMGRRWLLRPGWSTCMFEDACLDGCGETHSECEWGHFMAWVLSCVRAERVSWRVSVMVFVLSSLNCDCDMTSSMTVAWNYKLNKISHVYVAFCGEFFSIDRNETRVGGTSKQKDRSGSILFLKGSCHLSLFITCKPNSVSDLQKYN